MLGVGWGAERPGTSIVVVADGPEPLRSDIRLPLTPIRKICVKTCTLGVPGYHIPVDVYSRLPRHGRPRSAELRARALS